MNPWRDNLTLPKELRGVLLLEAADKTTADARALGEEELRATYQRGREDAEKAMGQQLLQQRSELHELMRGVLEALRNAVPQVFHDTENTLIALALASAQKLVAEMPISTSMVEAVVRDALAQVEGTAQFTVRLHPSDLELLQKSASPLLNAGDDAGEFRFLSSSEVTRGGCLVQTRFGTVDARRETKFDLLQRNMLA
jgi:flagellar biosynthesis/type III secretory pathway protein FliH